MLTLKPAEQTRMAGVVLNTSSIMRQLGQALLSE